MNLVMLIGRLAKDPELRVNTNTQKAVCNFSVAVNREYKREGSPNADFFQVVCFDKQAENVCKYLSKGREVAVVGRIENDSYEKDGEKKYVTRIMANRIEFIGGKNSEEFTAKDNAETTNGITEAVNKVTKTLEHQIEGFEVIDEDDVPF